MAVAELPPRGARTDGRVPPHNLDAEESLLGAMLLSRDAIVAATEAGLSADEAFARELLAQYNVTVLPGSYLARASGGTNPGAGRVRMALVAEPAECLEAAERIVRFCREQSR